MKIEKLLPGARFVQGKNSKLSCFKLSSQYFYKGDILLERKNSEDQ